MARRPIEAHEIPDDADLTQYGERGPDGPELRNSLRIEEGETELSLILGKVDRRAAATLVTKCWRPLAAVRHTTAAQLRARNYLAWAPFAATDEVAIFDRFNGVPSLGVVRSGDESHLFWRAAFYVSDISLWLYVPLADEELRDLDGDDEKSLLDGRVIEAPEGRYATVAVAFKNRVVFEREWRVEPDRSGEAINVALTEFVADALALALKQDPPLPPTRRDVVQHASEVVRQMAPC